MSLLDLSLFVVVPADLLLVLVAFVLRRHHDRRWFGEALLQGIVVGGGAAFLVSIGLGAATGSNVLPAFLILILGPVLFGVTFAGGLAGRCFYRFLGEDESNAP